MRSVLSKDQDKLTWAWAPSRNYVLRVEGPQGSWTWDVRSLLEGQARTVPTALLPTEGWLTEETHG